MRNLNGLKVRVAAAIVAWSVLPHSRAAAQVADGDAASQVEIANPAAVDPDAAPTAPVADAAPTEPVADADDLDSLLNAVEQDVGTLNNVSVSSDPEATQINPVVEGVSKKAEPLAESPGIVDVITAKDIEEFGAKNLYEVLQRATSVFMTGSSIFRQNVASIRGNVAQQVDNHVLVLINGRPFRDVTYSGRNAPVYAAFPIHLIERVEVIRGPGSVLYGTNAFNGVINVVTKNPDQPMMHASTLNGSYGWQSYALGAGNGNETQGALAGASYTRQKGFPFTATGDDPPGPAPAQTRTAPWGEDNVGAFAMYREGGFTANLFAARVNHESLNFFGGWPSQRLDDPRVFVDLGYALELDDWQSMSVNFTYNYDGTNFIGATGGVVDSRSNSYIAEATYRAELTDNWDVLVGGLVDFHEGFSGVQGSPLGIPQYTEIWYGVYMQVEYQALEWLKLVGGMQGNMPGEIPGGIVPRFGAIATLDEHWTGKFLYGGAFRSPYQLERSLISPVVLGNPDLTPELIQTFDCQLAYSTDDFRLAATYFHSDLFDIVTRTSGIPIGIFNGGSMTFDGVELENDWILSERWRTLSSMTYQTNKRDGVSNTTTAPNWMAKMGLAYHDDRGLTVGLFDTFFGDQTVPPTAAIVNPNPDAYHLMSLNSTLDLDRALHWHTGHKVQAQFLIQNLLDEPINHADFEGEALNSIPAGPGRTCYGGVTVQF